MLDVLGTLPRPLIVSCMLDVLGKSIGLLLFTKVVPDGCSWSLADGIVTLTLEKMNEGETWPVLTSEL